MTASFRLSRLTIAMLFVLLCSSAWAQTPNDMARFLAGLEPSAGSPLQSAARSTGWQQHANAMNRSWGSFEKRIIARIQVWARAKLPPSPPSMLYMFGGPDFTHADAFFPNARVYVLSGLEPVGHAPAAAAIAGPKLANSLASLRRSMAHYLENGYFITSQMLTHLKAGQFVGTVPLLYVFLARSGKTINKVEFVNLTGNGTVAPVKGKRRARGVRIGYTGRDGVPRTLYYFSTDLSNGGVSKSGFLAFCAKQGPAGSLAKSASYLYHNGGFSRVRDFVLKQSRVMVQDDTGPPFRFFTNGAWRLRAYGQYVAPIPVFKAHYQEDMAAFFARGAERVNFGIGYHSHPTRTGILVAVKAGAQ